MSSEPVRPAPAIAEELWQAAIADAGMAADDFYRFEATLQTPQAPRAEWWSPGLPVGQTRPTGLELTRDEFRAADRPPLLDKHRILIGPILDVPPELIDGAFAAKVRHEVEHARQWSVCGIEPFRLARDFAPQVWRQEADGIGYGVFINRVPLEADANAAASMFLGRVRPELVQELARHSDYGPLARAERGPERPETLNKRMAAFFFEHRESVEAIAASNAGLTVDQLFRSVWHAPNTANAWRLLAG